MILNEKHSKNHIRFRARTTSRKLMKASDGPQIKSILLGTSRETIEDI